jgi:hypothetical protein
MNILANYCKLIRKLLDVLAKKENCHDNKKERKKEEKWE